MLKELEILSLLKWEDGGKVMTENTSTTRYRVNIETTSKGLKSYSCTVESTEKTKEEVLAESDELVLALDKRYPSPAV
jgi:hypothetical protein|tara:strand:- start:3550 stop:3783 length:234 start_codon:yes stop_codon:yes gene_type:complete